VQEIESWLTRIKPPQPTTSRAILAGCVIAMVVMVCGGCVLLGTVAGFTFTYPGKATEQALSRATALVGQQEASPGPVVTPATQIPEAASTPQIETGPSSMTASVPPTTTESADLPVPSEPVTLPVTLAPMDIPAPSSALELTPTTQLTLSAVIFVENAGQFGQDVRYQVRGAVGGTIWLAPDAIWMTLVGSTTDAFGPAESLDPSLRPQGSQGLNLRLSFSGANPSPQIVPFDPSDTRVSYFSGSDPARWHTQVPAWGGVRYLDLYPGVDLELTSQNGQYVQRLVVDPGVDLSAVRLQIDGAQSMALQPLAQAMTQAGDAGTDGPLVLHLSTVLGEVSLPLLQVVASDHSLFPTSNLPAPRLAAAGNVVEFPFSTGPGDAASRHAGADLLYTTFLGEGGNDAGYAAALDSANSIYATGHTYFPAFPLAAGPFDASTVGNYDVFAVKVDATGHQMVYTAFLGGSGDERGCAIAVDDAGDAYVTGVTNSSDLPATGGAFDTSQGGGTDAFVAKVGASGTELGYTTFLGGSADDWGQAIAVDGLGNAYVTGSTRSANFPATTGAWDTSFSGSQDAFLVKVNGPGTGLAYATFLGGGGVEYGSAVAVDGEGRAYAAGSTQSPDFPTTLSAVDTSFNGEWDAFVVQANGTGTALLQATFLGGSSADYARAIAVDGAGSVYLTGATQSSDWPTTSWAFDSAYHGGFDAFIVKLNAEMNALGYAALLGGSGEDWGQSIAVDGAGRAYLTGSSQSFEMPEAAKPFAHDYEGGHDAFVARVNELGTTLAYATFLGAGGDDLGRAIAVDGLGSAYVAGITESPGLGTPTEGLGLTGGLALHTFVSKVVVGTPFLDLPVSYTNFAQAALGNMGDTGPGRVNSWFDHSYPDSSKNHNLARWDGISTSFTSLSPSRIGESWYDGHGGTDFRWDNQNESIFAAAAGMVIDTITSCRVGDETCGGGFGNRVWIDHGNGYASVYAHLSTVFVTKGTVISASASQPLGIMGNTGRSQGTHLHFGLYYDWNRDGRWTKDEVVDPYGWAGTGPDPWSNLSRYLWKYPLSAQQVVASPGTTIYSPSGLVTATIPAGALGSAAVVELWDTPSLALKADAQAVAAAPQWRATGQSFWLLADPANADPNTLPALGQPVILTLKYQQEDMLHLDPSRLTLRRWDESENTWKTLATRVDTYHKQIMAQTTAFGHFDLHAPVACSTDGWEPDDHYGSALPISTDGRPLTRAFDLAQDRDWFQVKMHAGKTYEVRSSGAGVGVGSTVQVRDLNSLSLLASGEVSQKVSLDASQPTRISILRWRPARDGTYLLLSSPATGSAVGCNATYQISVTEVYPLDRVVVSGPTTGIMQTSCTFTATVGPITTTQPITYTWKIADVSQVTHVRGLGDTFNFEWPAAGTFDILVRAANTQGVVTATHTVVVYAPALASFTASPITGTAPLKVSFANTSTGDYTTSLWDFGDGSTSPKDSPAHTYEQAGIYTVTLTVGGPAGTDTRTKSSCVTVEKEQIPVVMRYGVYLPIITNNH
jgi:murein DD-endopeptidase MepM/ murein hydrolase activator NlpD